MLIFILTLRNMNFWNIELKLEQHFQQACLGLFLHSTQGCFIHSAFHWSNISTGNKSFTFIMRETPKLKSPYSWHAEVGISRVPRSSNALVVQSHWLFSPKPSCTTQDISIWPTIYSSLLTNPGPKLIFRPESVMTACSAKWEEWGFGDASSSPLWLRGLSWLL